MYEFQPWTELSRWTLRDERLVLSVLNTCVSSLISVAAGSKLEAWCRKKPGLKATHFLGPITVQSGTLA